MNQEPELTIDPKVVIDGFCWAYCNALAEELEKLLETGMVWHTPQRMSLSDPGELVVRRLMTQLQRPVPPPGTSLEESDSDTVGLFNLLGEARQFLAIFEKK